MFKIYLGYIKGDILNIGFSKKFYEKSFACMYVGVQVCR